jgi:hypothetical protein
MILLRLNTLPSRSQRAEVHTANPTQLQGSYRIKSETPIKYMATSRTLLVTFQSKTLRWGELLVATRMVRQGKSHLAKHARAWTLSRVQLFERQNTFCSAAREKFDLLHPHLSTTPYQPPNMSDEVYDGAIGIDLGMLRRASALSGDFWTSAYTA